MANTNTLVRTIVAVVALGYTSNTWAQTTEPPNAGKEPATMTPVKPEAVTLAQQIKPGGAVNHSMPNTIYTFTLSSFAIEHTRSLHNDTDFVSISVAVGDNTPFTLPTKSMGDLNNGTYKVDLAIPDVEANPTDKVAFVYSIVNTGYDKNTIEQKMKTAVANEATKAAAKAGSTGGTLVGGTIGGFIGNLVGQDAGGWLVDKILGVVFANCDGPVAAGEHVYSGAQLSYQTAGGHLISATDDNQAPSPHGCGFGDTHYTATWSISGRPKTFNMTGD